MVGSRPRIILCAAASIDGRIATISGDSRLSSAEDTARVHRLRASVDAILVGSGTAIADDPLLTVRHAGGRSPVRVILDSTGRMPADLRIFKTARQVPTIIATSSSITKDSTARLARLPVEVIVTGTDRVDIGPLVRALWKRGIRSVLVEGGAEVNWSFIKSGLFDEMYLTVSPFVLGGTGAVPLVGGDGFKTVRGSRRLALVSSSRLGDHIVLHYKRVPKADSPADLKTGLV